MTSVSFAQTLSPVWFDDLQTARRIVLDGLKGYTARVYLFGSQATGQAWLRSDIDIAVMPGQEIPEWEFSKIREALEESDIVRYVDLVNLSDTDSFFQERVFKEGILWKE